MHRRNHHKAITTGGYVCRVLVIVASIALLVAFIPRGNSIRYEYSIGKPWHDSPVMAKETFPLLKSDSLLAAERKEAQKSYKPIFEMDTDVGTARISDFTEECEAQPGDGVPREYRKFVVDKLTEIYESGIISAEDYESLRKDNCQSITISVNNEGWTQARKSSYTPKTSDVCILSDADSAGLNRGILQTCDISKYISSNLTYDQSRSGSLRESIERSISKYRGEIQAGQEIVRRGQIVDQSTYLALRSLETFYKNEQKKTEAEKLSQIAGHALYVTLVVLCLVFFFTRFRGDYIQEGNTVLFLVVMMLAFPLITYALAKHGISAYIAFVVPYCIVPIFVCVFLDSRTAFVAHLCCVLLSALAVPYQFEFIITELVAGLVAIYSIRQLTQRSELFATVVYVALASLACYLCFDLINMAFFRTDGFDRTPYFLILANGVLLFISYLLLFPFERLFRFTSNVTLVELSNTNNTVLRRLSEEAPGTFQHSIQVANLAAEVADKLGGNSQLARTGALYHDIGKLKNPAYFTENQSGNNPHDALTYSHSARLIISHVRDGLDLADKYKLPAVIRDFIATHHGTGKARFFYVSYQKAHPGEDFDENLFAYPGPDPSTLEQAVLMMADAVEASARSLKEYTEENVNELVDRIVDLQVSEGRFNECPITFEAISCAKRVFKEKLKSIYHTRISYPELDGK